MLVYKLLTNKNQNGHMIYSMHTNLMFKHTFYKAQTHQYGVLAANVNTLEKKLTQD